MSAEQNINPQDYELLSAYIDGELTNDERVSLEQRLAQDSFLQHELNSLRATVSLIHTLQPMTAPRNFTLTEAMVKTPKIIPFKPRRRMRTEYLSLVASVMLMLFGVMFMVTEMNDMQSFSTGSSAPFQSDSETEKIANAPTLLPTEADLQAERTFKEPETLGATANEEAEENPAEDNTVLNMQAPAMDEGNADLRQENFDGDTADIPADGMLYSMEASSAVESTIVEGDVEGYAVASETQLLDTTLAEETFAQDAPQPMASGGIADSEAMNDTAITGNEISDNNGERDDALDEVASDDSSEEIGRIMSQATEEIPPPPLAPQDSLDREQVTPTESVTNTQIGIGLLIIGVLLLIASATVLRRNRS